MWNNIYYKLYSNISVLFSTKEKNLPDIPAFPGNASPGKLKN